METESRWTVDYMKLLEAGEPVTVETEKFICADIATELEKQGYGHPKPIKH